MCDVVTTLCMLFRTIWQMSLHKCKYLFYFVFFLEHNFNTSFERIPKLGYVRGKIITYNLLKMEYFCMKFNRKNVPFQLLNIPIMHKYWLKYQLTYIHLLWDASKYWQKKNRKLNQVIVLIKSIIFTTQWY